MVFLQSTSKTDRNAVRSGINPAQAGLFRRPKIEDFNCSCRHECLYIPFTQSRPSQVRQGCQETVSIAMLYSPVSHATLHQRKFA